MSLPRLAAAFVVAAMPTASLAQSATDDSDLFPADEQVLRFGGDDASVTFSPFVRLDGGYRDVDPDGALGGLDDGWDSSLRLARLYAFLDFGRVGGTIAYNFHDTDFEWAYAFATYEVTDALTLKFGQQDEPFSLQDMSGGRFLPFAEAGQSAALIPSDEVGVTAFYAGDRFSLAGGVFGGDLNTGVSDGGIALTGRATWAPVYQEGRIARGGDATPSGVGTQRVERLLHLGVGASARFDIERPLSFAGGGSSSLIETSLASTATFDRIDSLLRGNLEFAWANGPTSVQAELTAMRVDGVSDGRRIEGNGHGGYLYVTHFLTGERRAYAPSGGTFGRVVPERAIDDGGYGAIEVGARLDYLDLTDIGPDGGAQWGASLVVNNYLTKRLRLVGDYSHTRITDGPRRDTDVQAVTLRLQFAY